MAELSGQQVLVTGGAGFVGRSVVRALAQQRARVTVVDLQPFPDGDVRSVVGEITDPATRDAAVHEGLDGIVHLAAVTSVLRSMEDPAGVYQANVAATAGLLELARIRGDGTQRRDFVHVDDVVQGLLLAWRRRCTGSLIIGSGRSISVLDLLDQARRVTGRPLPAVHVAPKPGEMPAVVVDIGRARSLGYEPTVELEDGLLTAWADFAGPRVARVPVTQAPRP